MALLEPAGIREIVLVTHGTHMPRALCEFRAAAAARAASPPVRITPAPMGQAWPADSALLRWLPSGEGVVACAPRCTRCWPAWATAAERRLT